MTQITFATFPGLGFITYETGMTIVVTSSAVNRSQGQAVLRRWLIGGRAPAQEAPEGGVAGGGSKVGPHYSDSCSLILSVFLEHPQCSSTVLSSGNANMNNA